MSDQSKPIHLTDEQRAWAARHGISIPAQASGSPLEEWAAECGAQLEAHFALLPSAAIPFLIAAPSHVPMIDHNNSAN